MRLKNYYNGRPISILPQSVEAITQTGRLGITLIVMKSGYRLWVAQSFEYVNRMWKKEMKEHMALDYYK